VALEEVMGERPAKPLSPGRRQAPRELDQSPPALNQLPHARGKVPDRRLKFPQTGKNIPETGEKLPLVRGQSTCGRVRELE